MNRTLLIVTLLVVQGCGTVPLYDSPLWEDSGQEMAKVFIYRPSGSHTKYVPIYFGVDEKYALGLKENEFTWLDIPVGTHIFSFKVPDYKSEKTEITIQSGAENCLMLKAMAQGWKNVLWNPNFMNEDGYYALKKTECLNQEELEKYSHAVE